MTHIRSLFLRVLLVLVAFMAPGLVHAASSSEGEELPGGGEVEDLGGVYIHGKDLFRGLILADGFVAERIPELHANFGLERFELSDDHRKMIRSEYDALVAKVDEVDPGFFDKFAELVHQGDEESIADALYLGNRMLSHALYLRDWKDAPDVGNDAEQVGEYLSKFVGEGIEPVVEQETASAFGLNVMIAKGLVGPDQDVDDFPVPIQPYIRGARINSMLLPFLASWGVDFAKVGGVYGELGGTLADVIQEMTAKELGTTTLIIIQVSEELQVDIEEDFIARWIELLLQEFGEVPSTQGSTYPSTCLDRPIEYLITVKTGSILNAGTSAGVDIQLFGNTGSYTQSPWVRLDKSGYNDHERGKTDFHRPHLQSLGMLERFHLKHNNSNHKPGWYVDWVEIYDPCANLKWRADVYRWLDKTTGLDTLQELRLIR